MLQHLPGGFLLGVFLGGAFCTSNEFNLAASKRQQTRFDGECFLVLRAGLLHESLFKKFYEEAYPLAVFVRAVFRGRRDIVCALSSDQVIMMQLSKIFRSPHRGRCTSS